MRIGSYLPGRCWRVGHVWKPSTGHREDIRYDYVSSSRDDGLAECGGLVVVLSGLQAVVKLAEHPVEQVPHGRGVAVSDAAAPVIVASGSGGAGKRGEGPDEAGCRQSIVFHPAVGDHDAASGCACDRRRARKRLESAGIGEPVAIVTDLGQHPGPGGVGQSRERGDDRVVRVLHEGFGRGGCESVDAVTFNV